MEEFSVIEKIASELPFIAILLLVVFFFVREMRGERNANASSQKAKDELFTESLDKNTSAINANTQTLKDLDKTIALMQFKSGNGNNGYSQRGEARL